MCIVHSFQDNRPFKPWTSSVYFIFLFFFSFVNCQRSCVCNFSQRFGFYWIFCVKNCAQGIRINCDWWLRLIKRSYFKIYGMSIKCIKLIKRWYDVCLCIDCRLFDSAKLLMKTSWFWQVASIGVPFFSIFTVDFRSFVSHGSTKVHISKSPMYTPTELFSANAIATLFKIVFDIIVDMLRRERVYIKTH